MMVPTRPMGVTVRQLFRSSGAHVNDFNIKGQGSTGHRMVGIDIRELMADLGNHHMPWTLLGLHLGDHARLPAFGTHQMLDRHPLDGISLARSVGFIGSDGNTERITGIATFHA